MKLFLKCLTILNLLLSIQLKAQNIDSLTTKAISGSNTERLDALRTLGDYYFYKAPKSSDSLYRVALDLAKLVENEREQSRLYSYIGLGFNETANADSILFYQHKSLELALKIKDSAFIASAYGNIGNAYLIKENNDVAIDYYNKALAIFEAQGNLRLQGITYGTFANIYIDLKDYKQGIYYNEKARTIFKDLNFIPGYASSTVNLGICHQRLENYEAAITYLEEGKKICLEHNINRLLRVATLQLGNINLNYYKNYESAKRLFKETEGLAISFGDYEGIGQSNYSLGQIAMVQNQNAKAISYFKKAVSNFKVADKKKAYSNALTELISALKANGNNSEAISYYDELIVFNDSVFNEKSRAKSLELLAKFDVAQKNKEIEIQNLKLEQQTLEISQQRNTKIFLFIFSGLLLILLYFVWRTNKYKKLNQHHKIKSKRYELEQRLLRSQMNPHFIFNALNSIQSYVSENNTMDSEIYLSRFSHLMRQILEHSQEEFIALKDDLNALDAYLNLEQLRFEQRFNYQFDTNNIDETTVMIPPMLLQPFVENAILHGLEPKTADGLVKIDITIIKAIEGEMHYGILLCTISDNGIGRDAAAKKEVSPNREHVSLALKLITERLANYSEITNELYHIEIEDLFENNVPSGTKINIEMPYTQDLL